MTAVINIHGYQSARVSSDYYGCLSPKYLRVHTCRSLRPFRDHRLLRVRVCYGDELLILYHTYSGGPYEQ